MKINKTQFIILPDTLVHAASNASCIHPGSSTETKT